MVISKRKCVQFAFLVIVLFIGIRFYQFISLIEAGIIPDFERPPGVEAFLPIGALVSFKYFLFTGIINNIHPSGLVLFLIICLTGIIAKKSFCGWVCPFGLFSDFLTKIHKKIFKNGFFIPPWLDLILRSLKYIIVGFFLYTIFFRMPINSIERFINSSYNRFSDLKMLQLFTNISGTTVTVIATLLVLSVIIRNLWCRYLCPYGALLGIISFFSFGKIIREPANCTDCGKCEKECPGFIKIREKKGVNSTECIACLKCVDTCLEKKAIGFSYFSGRFTMSSTSMAIFIVLVFSVGIIIAKLSDHWQNNISKQEYQYFLKTSKSQAGPVEKMSPEKMKKIMQLMKARKKVVKPET